MSSDFLLECLCFNLRFGSVIFVSPINACGWLNLILLKLLLLYGFIFFFLWFE